MEQEGKIIKELEGINLDEIDKLFTGNEDLKKAYELGIKIIKKYMDIPEDDIKIIVIWIIGTYMHKSFISYPYLFFNAMKGSGKTRFLKLIAAMSLGGEVLNSLNEAVLFRTAANTTFCIDEFERVASKDKATLRELLNSAYKKGIKVKRAYKKKGVERETQEIEEFELFCPIAMANIWGMEEVLADRCIPFILERTTSSLGKVIEIFDEDDDIKVFREIMRTQVYDKPTLNAKKSIIRVYKLWNLYITTYTTYTYTYNNTNLHNLTLFKAFKKIENSEINGRDLELSFPLIFISLMIDENLFDFTISYMKKRSEDKKTEEIVESKDVALLSYLSEIKYPSTEWQRIRDVFHSFKFWLIGDNEEGDKKKKSEYDWITSEWVGKALKRQNLIIQKRRLSRGIEVMIDTQKAINKFKMFKPKMRIRFTEDIGSFVDVDGRIIEGINGKEEILYSKTAELLISKNKAVEVE